MNVRTLSAAVREAANALEWEAATLEDFHAFAQTFGCKAGANVFEFVLENALKSRGTTLERLRAEQYEQKAQSK